LASVLEAIITVRLELRQAVLLQKGREAKLMTKSATTERSHNPGNHYGNESDALGVKYEEPECHAKPMGTFIDTDENVDDWKFTC
jgi:hypothetical protein